MKLSDDATGGAGTSLRSRVATVEAALAGLGDELVPERVAAHELAGVVAVLGRVERRARGARLVLTQAAADAGAWKAAGCRSPEEWAAKQHGTSVGEARSDLLASKRLADLPAARAAAAAGELSAEKAKAVAEGAAADPAAERSLLDQATRGDLADVRDAARRVRSRADERDGKAAERMYRRRGLRTWVELDGEGRGIWNVPPAQQARFLAALEPYRQEAFRLAREAGRRETPEALMADAMDMLCRDVLVDLDLDDPADPPDAPSEPVAPPSPVAETGSPAAIEAPGARSTPAGPGPRAPGDPAEEAGEAEVGGSAPPTDRSAGWVQGPTGRPGSATRPHPATVADPENAAGSPGPADAEATRDRSAADEEAPTRAGGADPRGTTGGEPTPSLFGVDVSAPSSGSSGSPDSAPSEGSPLGGSGETTTPGVTSPPVAPASGAEPRSGAPPPGRRRYGERRRGAGNRRAPAQVVVHVDHAALVRGHAEGDERCEIPGIGPVPVSYARFLAQDAVLQVLLTDGADVKVITSHRRYVPAPLRAALEARDRQCVVPGCHAEHHLEIDHVHTPFARGGATALANLARLCRYHHALKTYCGWVLSGGPGSWRFDPPP